MDNKTLFLFAKRILTSSSEPKSSANLRQLKEVLELQGAPTEQIRLLDEMIDSVYELRLLAREAGADELTEHSVEIATVRKAARLRAEEEARYRGRC